MSRARIILNILERCPLQTMYGEMPGGGGYSANTEYEIGAQRMAEAAHCILGSLAKLSDNTPFWVEFGHIEEEMELIVGFVKEYSKDLYVTRVWRPGIYSEASIESIIKKAPILKKKAESAKKRIDKNLPVEIKRLAEASYRFLIVLSEELLKSILKLKKTGKLENAYKSSLLNRVINDLQKATKDFLNLPRDATLEAS